MKQLRKVDWRELPIDDMLRVLSEPGVLTAGEFLCFYILCLRQAQSFASDPHVDAIIHTLSRYASGEAVTVVELEDACDRASRRSNVLFGGNVAGTCSILSGAALPMRMFAREATALVAAHEAATGRYAKLAESIIQNATEAWWNNPSTIRDQFIKQAVANAAKTESAKLGPMLTKSMSNGFIIAITEAVEHAQKRKHIAICGGLSQAIDKAADGLRQHSHQLAKHVTCLVPDRLEGNDGTWVAKGPEAHIVRMAHLRDEWDKVRNEQVEFFRKHTKPNLKHPVATKSR